MKSNKLTVIQNYKAKTHILPILELEEAGEIEIEEELHLDIIHQLGRAILGQESIKNPLKNTVTLFKSLFWKDRNIYMSRYAYDIKSIPYIDRLEENNTIIQDTSWPHWDDERPLKPIYLDFQKEWWHDHIRSTTMVSVTKYGANRLMDIGAEAYYIPHSVDTEVYRPKETAKEGPLRVLFVGKLSRRKGTDTLIEVIKQGDNDGYEYHFVGDGPLEEQVKDLAKNSPVYHHGYIDNEDDLAACYRESDVLVLPSKKSRPGENFYPWEELFGIVIIEAFASGLPVISTTNVGPRDIIEDGVTGYLISDHSPSQLEDALDRCQSDKSKIAEMGKNAREEAINNYDIKINMNRWLHLMQNKFISD